MIWEEALFYQTVALLLSQALLFSVASLRLQVPTMVLALVAFGLTLGRTRQLRAALLAPSQATMPLQRRAQLDRDGARTAEPPFSLRQYEAAAASERGTLLDLAEHVLVRGANVGLGVASAGLGAGSDVLGSAASGASALVSNVVRASSPTSTPREPSPSAT